MSATASELADILKRDLRLLIATVRRERAEFIRFMRKLERQQRGGVPR